MMKGLLRLAAVVDHPSSMRACCRRGASRLCGRRHSSAASSSASCARPKNDVQQRWKMPNHRHQGKLSVNSNKISYNKKSRIKAAASSLHSTDTNPKSQKFQAPFSAFISCLPGLEPMLLQEVEYLHSQWPPPLLDDDYSAIKTKDVPHILPGGVKLTVPSLHHLYLLHLYLGTATHIYIRLNDDNLAGGIKLPPLFRARGFAELQRKIEDLIVSQRWDEWLLPKNNSNNNDNDDDRPDDGKECKVQVHVTTSKSKLMHTKAIEERVKQSIQQVFSNVATDNTTESDAKPMSRIRLMIRIDRDVVQLSLDTSQTPLHRRGYRLKPHKAPLREDLAYALLMSGGLMPNWDLRPQFYCSKSSPHRSSERTNHRLLTLYDPFCGSGTIAIEGACLQLGLPPGRFLPPPFDGTTFCNPALWEEMKSKAMSVLSSAPQDSLRVAAGDIDQKAIDAAEANAKRAGVYKWMDFRKISFVLHPLLKDMKNGQKSQGSNDSSPSLLVVTNPPYGIRSPDETKNTIYRKLAKVLSSSSRRIDCAIIGKNIRAMRESGMPLEVIFSTKHGGLNVVAMSGRVTP